MAPLGGWLGVGRRSWPVLLLLPPRGDGRESSRGTRAPLLFWREGLLRLGKIGVWWWLEPEDGGRNSASTSSVIDDSFKQKPSAMHVQYVYSLQSPHIFVFVLFVSEKVRMDSRISGLQAVSFFKGFLSYFCLYESDIGSPRALKLNKNRQNKVKTLHKSPICETGVCCQFIVNKCH